MGEEEDYWSDWKYHECFKPEARAKALAPVCHNCGPSVWDQSCDACPNKKRLETAMKAKK